MQISANFDNILKTATFWQFLHFYGSFFGILKFDFLSDWQIYKMAGRRNLV